MITDPNVLLEIAGGACLAVIVSFFVLGGRRSSNRSKSTRNQYPKSAPRLDDYKTYADGQKMLAVEEGEHRESGRDLKDYAQPDPYTKLKRLKELRDSEVITEAEFEDQKKKLLMSL